MLRKNVHADGMGVALCVLLPGEVVSKPRLVERARLTNGAEEAHQGPEMSHAPVWVLLGRCVVGAGEVGGPVGGHAHSKLAPLAEGGVGGDSRITLHLRLLWRGFLGRFRLQR